jgi:hypothetical protein
MATSMGIATSLTNFLARKQLIGAREEYRVLAPICCEYASWSRGSSDGGSYGCALRGSRSLGAGTGSRHLDELVLSILSRGATLPG